MSKNVFYFTPPTHNVSTDHCTTHRARRRQNLSSLAQNPTRNGLAQLHNITVWSNWLSSTHTFVKHIRHYWPSTHLLSEISTPPKTHKMSLCANGDTLDAFVCGRYRTRKLWGIYCTWNFRKNDKFIF